MGSVTSRQYRLLVDHMDIYRFMLELYEQDWRNGVPAPFMEYALCSTWLELEHTHLNRVWEEDGRIVGLCFYENPATNCYFNLRPGYEGLAGEMVAYAGAHMPNADGKHTLVLMGGQTALVAAAKQAGYRKIAAYCERAFDFNNELDYPLPHGFRFTEPGELDIHKVSVCCYKGFDHEEEDGPYDGDANNSLRLLTAPHGTPEHALAVVNEAGEYVCFAGMWWTPENRLAYMEPLCTVPEYRGKGLAAAALSEHARRLRPLGAAYMTGGSGPFYESIGFAPMTEQTYWRRA